MARRKAFGSVAGMIVAAALCLLLTETRSSAIFKKRDCALKCFREYIDQIDSCQDSYCPDVDHCDVTRLNACMALAQRFYMECLRDCR